MVKSLDDTTNIKFIYDAKKYKYAVDHNLMEACKKIIDSDGKWLCFEDFVLLAAQFGVSIFLYEDPNDNRPKRNKQQPTNDPDVECIGDTTKFKQRKVTTIFRWIDDNSVEVFRLN